MKHRLRSAALFLGLGVALNVAVAWLCALTLDGGMMLFTATRGVSRLEHPRWELTIGSRPGATVVMRTTRDPSIPQKWMLPASATQEQIDSWAAGKPDPKSEPAELVIPPYWSVTSTPATVADYGIAAATEDARGWPMLSLVTFYENTSGRVESTWGIPLNSVQGQPMGLRRILPVRPIPLGFLVNSVVYGALLWIVFYCAIQLRSHLRRKRGLCPKCGYRCVTSTTCPECGLTDHRIKTGAT